MRKEGVENICKSIGRIRRRGSMIKEGRDSNLLSIETSIIKINNIIPLRMNPRGKTPWEKWEDNQSNFGGENMITCTSIFLTKKTKSSPCIASKKILITIHGEKYSKNICSLKISTSRIPIPYDQSGW
jgi:hypothetical protein